MLSRLFLIALLTGAAPAVAQQSANNAVTQSEDAFGRAVGNERIGIYSNEEVRGFNPIEAGNNRLEGLYIEIGNIVSPRLLESSSVKVGYGASGTYFPAPTGIVDLRIEKFAGAERYSVEFDYEDNASIGGGLEAKVPLVGDTLGVALGIGSRRADQIHGRSGNFLNIAAGLSWLPSKGSEFHLFTSRVKATSAEFPQTIFPAGSFLPPRQPRKLQQVQPWAHSRFNVSASGGIAKFPIGALRIEAGLFRTTRRDPETYATLLLGTSVTGAVRNTVVLADQGNYSLATSGELRLIRTWTNDKMQHSLIASLRGRDQDRAFGGQQTISLGASQAGVQDFRPKPAPNFADDDVSKVRQYILGLQYNLRTKSGSSLSLALQKARYRKATDFANAALTDTVVRDAPWLYSASGALAITPRLTAYAGIVRGQEDSAVAPDIAVNRSEAPPALRTRQMDAGLRYSITPKLTLIGGAYAIRKPSFGIDDNLRFTNLGTVSNRGFELSLAGSLAKGLTVVAGGIIVNPTIKGPLVDAGRIGKRPTGSFRSRGIFNLDWRPRGDGPWSVDLALDATSAEMADRLNTFQTEGRSSLNVGARYRFAVGQSKIMMRAQVQNLFDSYSNRVNSGGGISFTLPRTLFLQMIGDF
jgi:iron complex outermembrane recepter protein